MVDKLEDPQPGGDGHASERLRSAVTRVRGWALARPEFAVRRAPNLPFLTRGVMGGAGAAVLVLVLVGGLVLASALGSAGRSPGAPGPISGASATPTDALANSPSFDPYQSVDPYGQPPDGSADASDALPTRGPAVIWPTLNLTTVATSKALASLPCRFTGMLPVPVADGRAYFDCDTDVIAVDIATNQVVARYAGVNRTSLCGMACQVWPDVILLDKAGGFWASAQIPATGMYVTKRYDIVSGKVTKQVDGWLMGGGGGVMYLWTDQVVGRSIRTGNVTGFEQVGAALYSQPPNADPWQGYWSDHEAVLCGSLLAVSWRDPETILDYQGWASDQHEPGHMLGTMEFGGVCWGIFGDGEDPNSPYHVTRFGPSGMDQRSPELSGQVLMWNGTIWGDRTPANAADRVYQRLDPTTWQPVGAPWRLPSSCYWPVDVAGAVWCGGETSISRMDLPMNGVTRVLPTPSPSLPASPSAAPSA